MKIQNMFQKDIDRDINGVIKVSQDDQQSLKQELSEYIITKELRRHFATFFDNYVKAIDSPTDKIGVWISGFFGSGKSHFLKMLSYLLSNKEVDGKHAFDYFADKFDDPMMYANVQKCVRIPTESILFNIDIEGPINKDKTAVLRVFTKVFYNHCGFYGEDLKVAKLERFIDKKGKTEAFRTAFKEVNGDDWINARDSAAFFEDDIVEVLQSVLGMSETAARNWFNGEENADMSIKQLVSEIKEYVDGKEGNFRLLFMVDEVGQYIGDDGDLMMNLQSLVEEIGDKCRGKVWVMSAMDELLPLVKCAELLAQKYDVVVTNPPYMGASGMNARLAEYVKSNYPNTKSDMSTVFMEKTVKMCKKTGYMSMINIPVWMFLSSYEKLRESLIAQDTFTNMVHFGRGVFGSDFGTTAFVIAKAHINGYKGTYCRLFEKQGAVDSVETKEKWFLEGIGRFVADQSNFSKIPGSPVAYWVSERMMSLFEYPDIKSMVLFRQGMATSDNNRFLRKWYEVSLSNFFASAKSLLEAKESARKWFPYNKGGEYRKWYGNHEYCVNWENDGQEMKAYTATLPQGMNVRLKSREYYFRPEISWSAVTSGNLSVRFYPCGFIFDTAGGCIFNCDGHEMFFLALLNAKIGGLVMDAINPTINNTLEDMKKIPVIFDSEAEISTMVRECVHISEIDWNSYETSWDFKRNPLV